MFDRYNGSLQHVWAKTESPNWIWNKFRSSKSPQEFPKNTWQKILFAGSFIGLIKGAFGGLFGLGGTVVAIPLLTSLGKLTQHQAHGTSIFAVFVSGLIGAVTYYSYGNKSESVDIPAAIVLSGSAMLTTKYGADLAQGMATRSLLRSLGGFTLLVTPLVFLKPYFKNDKYENRESIPPEPGWHQSLLWKSHYNKATLLLIGIASGMASGMFGVGGGLIMVPLLSIMTTQQMALGTSLLAMLGPCIVGSIVHYRLGNVYLRLMPPFLFASALGAWAGAKISVSLTEKQQRTIFSITMILLGLRSLSQAQKTLVVAK